MTKTKSQDVAMMEATAPGADSLEEEAVEEEVAAKDELIDLARLYKEADQQEKSARDTKAQLRGPIMDLISEVVREEIPLATKVVEVARDEIDGAFDGDARKWVALKYPEWDLETLEADEKKYKLTIRESDQLAKYEFSVDGYKFGRTTSHSSPEIDVDGLRTDKEFKALPAENVIVERTVYDLDEKAAAAFLLAHPESGSVFSRYTQPGEVKPKLLPFTAMREDA